MTTIKEKLMKKYGDWKLCLILDKTAYFSQEEPTKITGDDWNDAPYQYNAGPPYSNCFEVHFEYSFLETPDDWSDNLSVDQINSENIPWLQNYEKTKTVFPGDTFEHFVKLVKEFDGKICINIDDLDL